MNIRKKIPFLIIIFAIIAFAIIFVFLKFGKFPENNEVQTKNKMPAEIPARQGENKIENSIPESQNVFQGNKEEYKKMIGNWNTGCLIADRRNPLAEKHEFIIKENGTAQHWRSSGLNCENLSREKTTNNYKIEIPEVGKINFIALDNSSDTIYDIYKFEGNIIYFGHGPRDWYPLSLRNFGGSLETRFDVLNTFLKYKKQ